MHPRAKTEVRNKLLNICFDKDPCNEDYAMLVNYIIRGLNICVTEIDLLYIFPEVFHSDIVALFQSKFKSIPKEYMSTPILEFRKKEEKNYNLLKEQYLKQMLL